MKCWLRWICLVTVAAAVGCSGEYRVTAPDAVAPAGGEAPVVVRMQRNDFFVLYLAVEQVPVRLRVDDVQQRFAYTDKFGYAGTLVPVPDQPGRYPLDIYHQDSDEGDEVYADGRVYVWDPNRPAVAVDLDSLPLDGGQGKAAAAALKQWNTAAHLAYFTRAPAGEHDRLHDELEAAGFPDGPILLWKREYWHITRGTWNIPKIVVESRLVSQLGELRRMFPSLDTGLAGSPLGVKTFTEAGLRTIVVGDVEAGRKVRRVGGWSAVSRLSPAE
jgi:hypothetical protein